jgi:hypothetical protein
MWLVARLAGTRRLGRQSAVAATRASRFGLGTQNSNPHILYGSDSEKK